ncbi:MAG: redoxin domain-containing protein [Chitinophagales bacterium]|nr:redoxin domain-containing protein [Chitinophagales bacterium]
MALAVGTKAPDFKLFSSDKKEVSLADFSGKNLVIHFFPAAFTGVCTAQMCSSRDDLSLYNDLNASIVGVSVDMPFSLDVFKKQNSINFDLLSDFNKTFIKAYDMYQENFALGMIGVAKRGVIVVGKDGVVAYSEETANPGVQVNFDALKAALEKLK